MRAGTLEPMIVAASIAAVAVVAFFVAESGSSVSAQTPPSATSANF